MKCVTTVSQEVRQDSCACHYVMGGGGCVEGESQNPSGRFVAEKILHFLSDVHQFPARKLFIISVQVYFEI